MSHAPSEAAGWAMANTMINHWFDAYKPMSLCGRGLNLVSIRVPDATNGCSVCRAMLRKRSRRLPPVDVTECTVFYDHPCGCEGSKHSLLHDCWHFSYDGSGTTWDLFECRQCGAVWTLFDAPAFTVEAWAEALFDGAVNAPGGFIVNNQGPS